MHALRFSVLATLLFWTAGGASAHGGGLNQDGCHNDRKNGGYHCHRAPPVPATRPLAQPLRQDSPAAPTCFTGPRGGTYTVTASGRKNYGGC